MMEEEDANFSNPTIDQETLNERERVIFWNRLFHGSKLDARTFPYITTTQAAGNPPPPQPPPSPRKRDPDPPTNAILAKQLVRAGLQCSNCYIITNISKRYRFIRPETAAVPFLCDDCLIEESGHGRKKKCRGGNSCPTCNEISHELLSRERFRSRGAAEESARSCVAASLKCTTCSQSTMVPEILSDENFSCGDCLWDFASSVPADSMGRNYRKNIRKELRHREEIETSFLTDQLCLALCKVSMREGEAEEDEETEDETFLASPKASTPKNGPAGKRNKKQMPVYSPIKLAH